MDAFTAFCNESVALSSAMDVVSDWPSGVYCFGSAFGGILYVRIKVVERSSKAVDVCACTLRELFLNIFFERRITRANDRSRLLLLFSLCEYTVVFLKGLIRTRATRT